MVTSSATASSSPRDGISAPGNRIPLYKRILRPGTPDLAFAGLAQSVPTLFPFVECQARLIAAYAAGEYLPPAPAEMERVIAQSIAHRPEDRFQTMQDFEEALAGGER